MVRTAMRKKLGATLMLALVLVFSLVGTALAAELPKEAKQVDFSYFGTGQDTQALISVTLDDSVKLPAKVRFNFPLGATPGWVGEILGGDASKDPTVEFKKVDSNATYDVYEATLTKSHTLQAEGSAMPQKENATDGSVVISVSYAPAMAAKAMTLSTEIPKTAQIVQQEGVTSFGTGNDGSIYGVSAGAVKANEGKTAQIAYKTGATTNTAQGQKDGSNNTLIIILVVAVVVLIIGLLGYLLIQRMNKGDKGGPQGGSKGGKGSTKNKGAVAKGKRPEPAKQDKAKGAKLQKAVAQDECDAVESDSGAKRGGLKPKTIAVIITVAVALIGGTAIIIAGTADKAIAEVDGVYMKEFAQGDPCQKVTLTISEEAAKGGEKTAEELFDKLENAGFEVLKGKLDPKNRTLLVEFCESKTTGQNVTALFKGDDRIIGSSALETGKVLEKNDGSFDYFITETAPCAADSFTVALDGTDEAITEKIAAAVKDVPTMARLNYVPEAKLVTFGFCNEQANDDVIAKALKAAGIKAEVKDAMTIFNDETTESGTTK